MMQDVIADMLTRIRNAQNEYKKSVVMFSSNMKEAIAKVLLHEGYLLGYTVKEQDGKKVLSIELKYYANKGVISKIQRVSKPGLRKYCGYKDLQNIANNGFGITILSTPRGVISDREAKSLRVGGEVICFVF